MSDDTDTDTTDTDTDTEIDADTEHNAEHDAEAEADGREAVIDPSASDTADDDDAGGGDEASPASDVALDDFGKTADDEIDLSEYENQEWTLGQTRQAELRIDGMKFLLREPEDDDEIMQLLEQTGDYQGSLRSIVDMLVKAPAITDERWNEQMTARQRMLLAGRAVDWFGIDDFLDEDAIAEAEAEFRGQDELESGSLLG